MTIETNFKTIHSLLNIEYINQKDSEDYKTVDDYIKCFRYDIYVEFMTELERQGKGKHDPTDSMTRALNRLYWEDTKRGHTFWSNFHKKIVMTGFEPRQLKVVRLIEEDGDY